MYRTFGLHLHLHLSTGRNGSSVSEAFKGEDHLLSKNWYRRLLLSYFPIFLLTVSILIFLSFLVINEISRQETAKADRISTGYMMDTLERSVNEVELDVLSDVETSTVYSLFLNDNNVDNTGVAYQTIDRLRMLEDNNELIESIYMYRDADQQILTLHGIKELSTFADHDFVQSALQAPEERGWSSVRSFAEMNSDPKHEVITMYKRLPLPFGDQGLIVINVSVYAMKQMIASMFNPQVSFLDVQDAAGLPIYPSTASADEEHGKILTTLHSDRLNWTFESGIRAGQLFAWVSVISYLWILIGIFVVGVSIVYIIYITRKNYKPIQVMMERIESLQLGGESVRKDELSLIDHALESLIEQTVDYEQQHHENLLIRRRRLFMNWIEGERPESIEQELQDLHIFNHDLPASLDTTSSYYAVIVAEIKDYDAFREKGNVQEHNTLKLALTNVFQELAQQEGLQGWSEWISVRRAGIIIYGTNEEERQWNRRLFALAASSREWVEHNLHLTMTFGTGVTVHDMPQVRDSYESALQSLRYSMTLGRDGVVMHSDLPEGREQESYRYLQTIADLVKEFRLTQDSWRDHLKQMLDRAEEEPLRDESIRSLVLSLLQMLSRELEGMSEELDMLLSGDSANWAIEAIVEAETVEEIHHALRQYLDQVYNHYVEAGESTNYHALIGEMKSYIEDHFANPDLSLNHLSDRFNVTPKHVSHLFKAELDIKFIDFLVQLRLHRAEELLSSTDDTIQNIAIQVGYANSITFGRVFKRIIGVTPGDYRKLKMKPSHHE